MLPELEVCVAYELDGKRLDYPPYERVEDVTPVYETLEGWNEELTGPAEPERTSRPPRRRYLEKHRARGRLSRRRGERGPRPRSTPPTSSDPFGA